MIDWFMNGTSNKVKRGSSKAVNNDFLNMFLGQGHPNPFDRQTRQQGMFLKKTRVGSGMSHLRFWDSDGDGVINGLDCMPKNPKKHMPKVYHSTHLYAIDNIQKQGVLPRYKIPSGSQRKYDPTYDDYSYWSTNKDASKKYGKIILSTDLSDDEVLEGMQLSKKREPYDELRVPGEVLVKRNINPEEINVEENPYSEETNIYPGPLKKENSTHNSGSSPQTIWHAGDELPSEKVKRDGKIFGFSSKKYAEGWKDKYNKQAIFQVTTDNYELDPQTYSRSTPDGIELSDNEYIARNVLDEKKVDDDEEDPKDD